MKYIICFIFLLSTHCLFSDESNVVDDLKARGISCTFDNEKQGYSIIIDKNKKNKFLISGEDLKRILPLKDKTLHLTIYGKGITPEGYKYLSLFKNIEILNLGNSSIDDDSITSIRDYKKLKYLELSNTKITNKSLRIVNQLGSLQKLDLSETGITDDDMKELVNMHKLQFLILRDTSISDDSLEHILKLKNLKFLDLLNTKITKNGLYKIISMNNLEVLNLSQKLLNDKEYDEILELFCKNKSEDCNIFLH